ncbi:uncharacterized protein FPRO_01556 [Fusarium proliferatum ET1]|uniref:Secreted protein n=1 Tax=Fusarium proliferatum (strain ET1) TaxID=1227346 RepID=A0A1L7V061_FUSPR|nr:uncharacterized protein FPRO_01556 [Fusarium proliferatum ET1]CZR33839.1 uncharacterized protein FPRO_01556 [Fusarium proliferatum ET1]
MPVSVSASACLCLCLCTCARTCTSNAVPRAALPRLALLACLALSYLRCCTLAVSMSHAPAPHSCWRQ